MSHSTSHADFDVVTGPSMPPRPVSPPQRSNGSSNAAPKPASLPSTPIDGPGAAKEKRR